ncbi:MAG: 50S ribosomal protein L35ae [Promethearchaeota archaeon]
MTAKMSKRVAGVVVNFRRSRHTVHPKHAILKFEGYETREAAKKLVGKKVQWTTKSGKRLKGFVSRPHGKKGAVRAIFKDAGLPGQALGTSIDLFLS